MYLYVNDQLVTPLAPAGGGGGGGGTRVGFHPPPTEKNVFTVMVYVYILVRTDISNEARDDYVYYGCFKWRQLSSYNFVSPMDENRGMNTPYRLINYIEGLGIDTLGIAFGYVSLTHYYPFFTTTQTAQSKNYKLNSDRLNLTV